MMSKTPESLRIGWIGVGAMGLPMCAHLAQGGAQVTAFDLRPERLALAASQGIQTAASVGAAARGADVVFSMVFDDAALQDVVEGPDGVAAALAPETVYVDMSTVSPDASARVAKTLARNDIRYVRAPVSGSVPLAQAATLTVLASGERADFDRVQPLLCLLSQAQHFVGADEAARVVKLAINLMVVTSTALIGEALALGERQGVQREALVDALNASIVGSRHYLARSASLKSRKYNSNGPIDLVAKDLDLALATARDSGLDLPITELARTYVAQLHRLGRGDTEITVLAEHVENLACAPKTGS